MNKHALHYIELNPAPIDEPSDTVILLGALAIVAALSFILIVLFSL